MSNRSWRTRYGVWLSGAVLAGSLAAGSAHASILINEVYSGGGASTGSPAYKTDFIELYNTGPAAVDISGYKLDYGASASAAGTFASAVGTIPASTPLIPSGGFFLVQTGSSGTAGATDVTPDADFGSTSLAAGAGALRLSDNLTNVLDVVGWGSVNNFEGASEASPSSTAVSIQRIPDGLDTNNNASDFLQAVPTPKATNAVPEPTALALLGLATAAGLCRRRRK